MKGLVEAIEKEGMKESVPAFNVGDTVPRFSVSDGKGNTFTSDQFTGKRSIHLCQCCKKGRWCTCRDTHNFRQHADRSNT